MRVLYLANSILPSRYANGVHIMKMCDALSGKGCDVVLLAKTHREGLKYSSKEIHNYYGTKNSFRITRNFVPAFTGGSIFCIINIFLHLLKQNRKTTIYARDPYGAFIGWVLGYNMIYELHGLPTNLIIKLIEKLLLKTNTVFVYISTALRIKHSEYHKSAVKDCLVLHDGADPIVSGPQKNEHRKIKAGYIGGLYPGRGIEMILQIAKQLRDIEFHIVGGDDIQVSHYEGLSSPNVFFHGYVRPARVPTMIITYDIVLMPYQVRLQIAGRKVDTSGWMSPIKMFEYMSAKKAIISSDMPVLREVLNESNAILVPPADLDSWVEAVRSLSLDKERREKIGEKAFSDFIANYTWDKRAERIVSILETD